MIRTFADEETRRFWEKGRSKKCPPANLRTVAKRKLQMLHAAAALADLRVPPNNGLHALQKNRKGQHAIKINDQFRICFRWIDGDVFDVEITDYHDE